MNDPGNNDMRALLTNALLEIEKMQSHIDEMEQARREPIAIVGMACRFPGSTNTPEQFWQLLQSGGDAIIEVPPERWNIDEFYDPDPEAPGKTYTRWGGFLRAIEKFDASFFNIAPREAVDMDPQQRLLMEVTWEALESAGLPAHALAGSRTGVFIGISNSDYSQVDMEHRDLSAISPYSGTGNTFSVASGRISYFLGLQGPNFPVDTACSSSLVAVHLACQSLRNRECRMALAGGVNLILAPFSYIYFSKLRVMSADGRCKTFDAAADGYVRGEGCGMIVLKRLADAIADNDNILALIRATAVNHDGSSSGLTVPNGRSQEMVIRQALENAGVMPEEISYLEAHGTGTALGDPIEVDALNTVLCKQRKRPLLLGSVKTNIGHLEAAAGIAGLIKLVLSLQHRQIPPHLHFKKPSPHVPWDDIAVQIPTTLTSWETNDGPLMAALSSFGFSGTNAHAILQQAPPKQQVASERERPLHLLTLSSKSPNSLAQLADRYRQHLSKHASLPVQDVCYTANTGRSHFPYRLAVVTHDTWQLAEQLRDVVEGTLGSQAFRGELHSKLRPKIAWLFGGEDCYPQMGYLLYQSTPVFRDAVDQCARLVEADISQPLVAVLYPQQAAELLADPLYSGLAVFAVQYALSELWRSWGIEPETVMGYGIGEYAAACVAGIFNLKTALQLVIERGRLLQNSPQNGAMAAISATEKQVGQMLAAHRQIGIAVVSGSVTIISGDATAVGEVIGALPQGINGQLLPGKRALHSPLVGPLATKEMSCSSPKLEFVAAATGRLEEQLVGQASYWQNQLRTPIKFALGIATMLQNGCEVFMEIGADVTLTRMGQCLANDRGLWVASLSGAGSDYRQMLTSLSKLYVHGVKVDWHGVDSGYQRQRKELPTYPFEHQSYWVDTEDRKSSAALMPQQLLHPLLGRRLQSPALQSLLFESQVGVGLLPYLKDHAIHATEVFPATGYLEMAFAAAKELFPADNAIVKDMAIYEPLILADDKICATQVVVEHQNPQQSIFQIFSSEIDPEHPHAEVNWKLHCGGSLETQKLGTEEPLVVDEIKARCEEELSAINCYQWLRESGLEYGPNFQGIQYLWRQDGEALGIVKLPASIADAAEYNIHPAMLDACFQMIAAAVPKVNVAAKNMYLPMTIDSFAIYGDVGCEVRVHVALRKSDKDDPETLVGDVRLLNEAGQVLAKIVGLCLKRTGRETFMRIVQRQQLQWFYQIEWQEQELETSAEVQTVDKCLILADDEGVGLQIAKILEKQGTSCQIAFVGSEYAAHEAHWYVNPQNPQDLQRLCQEPAISAPPPQAILHLWSLQAQCLPETSDSLATQNLGSLSTLHLLQGLIAAKWSKMPQLWLITRQAQVIDWHEQNMSIAQSAMWGLGRVIALELPALNCKRLDLDRKDTADVAAQFVVREICSEHGEEEIAYRDKMRYVARLIRSGTGSKHLQLPQHQPFQLDISKRGILDNLLLKPVAREQPGAEEVIIRVHATGLNFRDVLNALGLFPGDAGAFGGECSGTIVAVGDNVDEFAVGDAVIATFPFTGTFRTFARVSKYYVVAKPENLSFEEAATIPITFLTAKYGLCHLANMAAGDRVLIHAAAGGVGTAAVQVARRMGAEIFGTAGNEEKRNFLKSLGVAHPMDSRSLDFAEEIMQDTNGEGVDIVLNSLAGEYIPKSIALLKDQGRFIELGKAEVWEQSQVDAVKSDVSYAAFDLAEECQRDPKLVSSMLHQLMEEFANDELKPLPYKTFPIEEVVAAFRYMAQAKHIGKIVVTQPTSTMEELASTTLIRDDVTYLISGGLGSLGLEVAGWLVDKGARHLVLLGRSAASTQAQKVITQFKQQGADVVVAQASVADKEQLASVLTDVESSLPPLAGVVHAAGVLDDGILLQQTLDRFAKVMAPKITGAWNLHSLTTDKKLDFFVLFSSIASVLGSPGQGNYAAANAVLDGLAQWRRAQGLPALSINWGPWADIGMAANLGDSSENRWAARGINMIGVKQGLHLFEQLLQQPPHAQVAVLPINWGKYLGQFPSGAMPPLYAYLAQEVRRQQSKAPAEQQAQLLQQLEKTPPHQRRQRLISSIQEQVARVLGFDSPQAIDTAQDFSELGLDSLTAVELINSLENALGQSIHFKLFFENPTIEAISDYLLQELLVFEEEEEEIEDDSAEEEENVAEELKEFFEDELAEILAEEIQGKSKKKDKKK